MPTTTRMAALPPELFCLVAAKCSILTLIALSRSSKAFHTAVIAAADVLFLEMASAATTIQARLVGGATLYRLARLSGRPTSIPQETLLDDSLYIGTLVQIQTDWGDGSPLPPFAWVRYKFQPEAIELLHLSGVIHGDAITGVRVVIAHTVAQILYELVLLRDVKSPIELVERSSKHEPREAATVWALTDNAVAQLRPWSPDDEEDAPDLFEDMEWTGLVIDFALMERALTMTARTLHPRKI